MTRLFDEVLVSAEIGAEKPNPVIFEAACARLGVDPVEALVVGDDRRSAFVHVLELFNKAEESADLAVFCIKFSLV